MLAGSIKTALAKTQARFSRLADLNFGKLAFKTKAGMKIKLTNYSIVSWKEQVNQRTQIKK